MHNGAALPALAVEVVENPSRLPALAAAWDPLVDERAPGAVFRSSAWLVPWWGAFGVGKRLRVLVAHRGGRVVGVLPAYAVPTALGGRRLRLMGDGIAGSDYLGAVAADGDRHAVAEAFAEHLVGEESDATLANLLDDEPLARALLRAADGAGATVDRIDPIPSPYTALDGGFADWLATLPNGAGKQLLRRRRWLEKRPGFRLEIATTPEAVAAGLEQLLRLHAARWSLDGGSDGIAGAAALAFHRRTAPLLARLGWARLYLLHVEGAVRAALYGFGRGGRFAYYQSGHEPAWRQRSVGTVVLGAAIEDAFARGEREFDFLHGDEPYKATFAGAARHLCAFRMSRGGRALLLRGAERWARAARRAVRERLPPAAVDWVRRRRRGAATTEEGGGGE